MKVRWHKAHGEWLEVELVDDQGPKMTIKHKNKTEKVPRHQVYTLEDPPRNFAMPAIAVADALKPKLADAPMVVPYTGLAGDTVAPEQ